MRIQQRAFMLPVVGGECFCVWRAPAESSALRGTVLHLPAFGDEMNKSRAMTASASRRFATHGFGVLNLDLSGTGDSSGEFERSSLSRWTDDACIAIEWLRVHGRTPLWLWCLRFGALLVPSVLRRVQLEPSLLLWQPVSAGSQYLTHLLRMKLAGAAVDGVDNRQGVAPLRQRIRSGETMEIAGYAVSSQLATELEDSRFEASRDQVARIRWLEVNPSTPPSLSPAARASIAELESSGIDVLGKAVQGPGFWHSAEIESCPGLIEASVTALGSEFAED